MKRRAFLAFLGTGTMSTFSTPWWSKLLFWRKKKVDPRQAIIAQYLNTAAGKRRLAMAMAMPLRQRLDYQVLARKAFVVDQLPAKAVLLEERST